MYVHAAAVGRPDALRRTRLSRHEARVALGLLSTDPAGENVELLRRPVGPGSADGAETHGWTTSIRHTAAIVYGRPGPRIVVVLAYSPKIDAAAAHALGAQVVRLAAGL